MKIERVERSGNLVEFVVDKKAYYLDITNIKTKQDAKDALSAQINASNAFDTAKFDTLKTMVGEDV